jgi:hypothetical protein
MPRDASWTVLEGSEYAVLYRVLAASIFGGLLLELAPLRLEVRALFDSLMACLSILSAILLKKLFRATIPLFSPTARLSVEVAFQQKGKSHSFSNVAIWQMIRVIRTMTWGRNPSK